MNDLGTAKEAHPPPAVRMLEKVRTGVPGLDDVLWGGLPAGRTTLVTGGSGCGKSILGLQFLYTGCRADAPGILVSFEERAETIRENALTFGWDLAAEEKEGRLAIIEARPSPESVLTGRFTLHDMLGRLSQLVESIGAKRVVLDGADALLRLFDDMIRERTELYSLHEWLVDHSLTTLLTAKLTAEQFGTARHEFLDFMAECAIHLRQHVENKVSGRLLRVIKCRGSGFGRYEYPCIVADSGLCLAPISKVALRHRPLGPRVSTGLDPLDSILAGGYRRGASIFVVGNSGTGKTTLAATLARAATDRGERVLYISFEQSEAELVDAMISPGIDFRSAIREGKFRHLGAMPEAMGAEEHLHRITTAIDDWFPHHVIADPISALNRLGSPRIAFAFVVRLVDICKQRGITCLLTTQRDGRLEAMTEDHLSLSSLMDIKILLRYVECGCRVYRALLVVKALGSGHSNRLHGFSITDDGLQIETNTSCDQPNETCARCPLYELGSGDTVESENIEYLGG